MASDARGLRKKLCNALMRWGTASEHLASPSASQAAWRTLTDRLAQRPAQWMLWEAEPREETARRLADLGVRCVVVDPCGNAPVPGADWLAVMRANVDRLAPVFR